MMKIKCGKWNWTMIYPFIYSASLFCRSFSSSFPSNNPFLPLILVSLSQLSIGIAELYSHCQRKKDKLNDKFSRFTDSKEDSIIQKIQKLVSCLLGFINLFIIHFLLLRDGNLLMKPFLFQRETILFGIIFWIFFYRIIFIPDRRRRGIHQKVSIAFFIDIIFILTIVWFLVPFRQIKTKSSDIIIQIIILVIFEAFFVSKHLIEQKIFDVYYISPYTIVFFEGIGSLIGLGVLMGLYKYIGCFSIFDVCSKKEYIHPFSSLPSSFTNYKYILIFVPCSILIELFIILTAKYRPIMDRSIYNLLFAFVRLVINMNDDIEIYGAGLFTMNILLNVIAIFWCLVYQEQIEVLYCNLDKDIYRPDPGPSFNELFVKPKAEDILKRI